MKDYQLTLKTATQASVLERILQVTRYRGFNVINIAMSTDVDKDNFDVELSVRSTQPIAYLQHQLNKLFDIKHVQIHEATTDAIMPVVMLNKHNAEITQCHA